MSHGEKSRQHKRENKSAEHAKAESSTVPWQNPGKPAESAAPRFRGADSEAVGVPAGVWILPTATEHSWAISDESDPQKLVERLRERAPEIFSIAVPREEVSAATKFGRESIARQLKERTLESLVPLVTRLALGGVWVLVALAGLRIPGMAKIFDEILLVAGLGFLGYTVFFNALPFLKWLGDRKQADQSFDGAVWRHSALLDRLAQALKTRRTLKDDERGKSPDAELLDANAYRKLIEEKITTPEELSTLGLAIERAMRFTEKGEPRKISEIARECGIDPETAIFYRDLAAAAAEIRLDHQYKIQD
ncbi:MAG TPA: hypothetical protein VEK08_08795 [Planctomycetota bacterium]|nr:hypothetical protein [Planctomycetota bacterium]